MSCPQTSTARSTLKNVEIPHFHRRQPTQRQRRYVACILEGRSKHDAALAAGYSRATAHNCARNIEAKEPVKQLLLDHLEKAGVTLQLLAQRLSECLDAEKTLYFHYQGRVTDQRTVVDFTERRLAVRLILEFWGLLGRERRREKGSGKSIEELLTGNFVN